MSGKILWITPYHIFKKFVDWGIIDPKTEEVDSFEEPLGGVFGELSIGGLIKEKLGQIK